MINFKRVALLAVILHFCGAAAAASAESPTDGIEAYVTRAMEAWDVPGLAMAIVKDDRVALAKGFGVRKRGEDKPVDAETLFAIGSTSKAFTAAALAMLIDEGKLAWDDRATKYLPSFELKDPFVTRELTVRDLLCHRSGLPRADALWYGSHLDRGEVLRRARFIKPNFSFRSQFGYQNIMYLAAGEIVPSVTHAAWDEFVKQRVFLRLGMKSSNTSVKELVGRENVAAPHEKVDDSLQALPWRDIDNIGPAGSINSNVNDMAQWLRLQLGDGVIDGTRLLSAAAVKEMRSPQTVMKQSETTAALYPDAHFMCYGLGWMLQDYHGRLIAEHGGGIDGMTSQVALIPEEKLGLVILTNRGSTGLPAALMFHVFDAYLRTAKRDWSTDRLAVVKQFEAKAREEKEKHERQRAKDTKPSLPLDKYIGKFTDELYGDLEVRLENDKLVMTHGATFTGDLEHWHYDTFRAKYRDKAVEPQWVTFCLDSEGKVAALAISDLAEFKTTAAK